MRFIVAVNSLTATAEGRNAMTALLESKGLSVWHWFQDLWLVDTRQPVDLIKLRDEIRIAIPSIAAGFFISSVEGIIDHAGVVPSDSITWLLEHWQRRS